MMIPQVLHKILPKFLVEALDKLTYSKLYEVRLRSERAVSVNFGGKYYYLSEGGLTDSAQRAVTVSAQAVKEIVLRAAEFSMYAVNDDICQGFLTIEGGIRIGVAGETVFDLKQIRTVKNYNALNIRMPHEVIGCADRVTRYLQGIRIKSALYISPPGAGKTTLLRDTARILSSGSKIYNVLLVDERNEIAAAQAGKNTLNVGVNCDVISGSTKKYAFSRAVRAMRPDIIVTDELIDAEDAAAVRFAVASGVTVIASVHAQNHTRISDKNEMRALVEAKVFERYVDLSDAHGPGTVDGIFDENFDAVYYP